VSAGLARNVGIATADTTEALRAVLDGGIDVIQLPISALELRDPSGADAVLTAARDADVGVLACSPLAGGSLGAHGDRELLEALAFLEDGAPRSVAQAMLAWVLTDPRVAAVVAGPSSEGQALENAGASALVPLEEAALRRIAAVLGVVGEG
jgi:aryl-alcohol dehydrogenase-like predicted oxidoreductase